LVEKCHEKGIKVVMDITNPIATPEAPWGWKD
jgi:glycosidase